MVVLLECMVPTECLLRNLGASSHHARLRRRPLRDSPVRTNLMSIHPRKARIPSVPKCIHTNFVILCSPLCSSTSFMFQP
eukprot:4316510-Karenia_brevis.AAC.1